MTYRILTLVTVVWMATALLTAWAGGDGRTSETAHMSGFVDASYGGNLDRRTDTFGLDQAEVDVTRCFDGHGGLRADFEWVKSGDEWDLDVEQGYLDYIPPRADRLTFSFGKFNAPIGFELLDAPDMYQYSHALVFDHGLPTNLTGAMLASDITDEVDVRAYEVNGWDRNDLGSAGPKTFGGRAGYSMAGKCGVGVSAISGSEMMDISDTLEVEFDRTVIDVDLTLTLVPGLLIGGEFNWGTVDVAGTESNWTGMLAMAHYDSTIGSG